MDFSTILWLVALFVGFPLCWFFFKDNISSGEKDSGDTYGCAVIVVIIIIVTIIIKCNTN
jgi:hypothetical protein